MRRKEIVFWTILIVLSLVLAPAIVSAQEKPAPAEEKKEGTGVVPAGVKLAPQMPKGAPPKPYPFPRPATKTLANGLRVFVVTDKEQPAVTVRLVLPAGSLFDPQGRPGVANMTADLITQGTTKRTAQQIAEAIDFVGGSLSSSADSDGTYVTVTVVKKDLDLALDILSDVVLHPSFRDEELERRRQQGLSGLRVSYSDPSYLASALFDREIFGSHPYGLPDEGTPDSLRAMKRDDLVKFRDAYYVPKGSLLAFAGDITPQAAFAAAEKFFGKWTGQMPAAQQAAPAAAHKGLRILLVDKPDAVQTQIRVGRLGIPRNSADYIPLLVTNRIFGGGFNSRLSTEVRVRKGLTYGANSNFDSRKLAGGFVASTSTRTEATVEATRLIVNLLEKMSTGEVSKEELDFARDYLAGVYPIQTETAEQVAGRILTVEQYGLPAGYNSTYQQKVLAVGPAEVKAMSAKYYSTANLDLVLVGNVGAFRDALKKDFPGAEFIEMPFDQVDLLAADLRKPKEAAAAASPEAIAQGQKLILASAEAVGASKVKVESVEMSQTAKITGPRGEVTAEMKVFGVLPNQLRAEYKLPFGVMVQGYDGQHSWMAAGPRTMDMPAQMNNENQRDLLLVGALGMYRRALEADPDAEGGEFVLVGEEEVQGKKLMAVDWNAPSGKVRVYVDPATGLIGAVRYTSTTPQGSSETLETWDDYRDVSGVKFPFHSVSYRDGNKFADQTVTDVKLNTKIDPAIFTKPVPQQ